MTPWFNTPAKYRTESGKKFITSNPIYRSYSNDMAAAELVKYNKLIGLVQRLTKTDRCQYYTEAFLPYVLFP